MSHRAANTVSNVAYFARLGSFACCGAIGFQLVGREHLIANRIAKLVIIKFANREVRTPFQGNYRKSGSSELVDHYAATCACADYTNIEFLSFVHGANPFSRCLKQYRPSKEALSTGGYCQTNCS